jgi:hypothetical protein
MNSIAKYCFAKKKFKHIIKKILPENDPENVPFSSRFPTRKQWFFLPKNYASGNDCFFVLMKSYCFAINHFDSFDK